MSCEMTVDAEEGSPKKDKGCRNAALFKIPWVTLTLNISSCPYFRFKLSPRSGVVGVRLGYAAVPNQVPPQEHGLMERTQGARVVEHVTRAEGVLQSHLPFVTLGEGFLGADDEDV